MQERKREEVGIGKAHQQGRSEGSGEGRGEGEGKTAAGHGSLVHLNKSWPVGLVKHGAHWPVLVSASRATGLCQEGRQPPGTHLSPQEGWEGRGEVRRD